MKNILILGGAGFIGSQLAKKFSKFSIVTIIDGLVDGTGGSVENIYNIKGVIFIDSLCPPITGTLTAVAFILIVGSRIL